MTTHPDDAPPATWYGTIVAIHQVRVKPTVANVLVQVTHWRPTDKPKAKMLSTNNELIEVKNPKLGTCELDNGLDFDDIIVELSGTLDGDTIELYGFKMKCLAAINTSIVFESSIGETYTSETRSGDIRRDGDEFGRVLHKVRGDVQIIRWVTSPARGFVPCRTKVRS